MMSPSLIRVGLLAGAVAGAPKYISVPVHDDTHELTDNESGAAASNKTLFTLLKRGRLPITNGHRVSLVSIARI